MKQTRRAFLKQTTLVGGGVGVVGLRSPGHLGPLLLSQVDGHAPIVGSERDIRLSWVGEKAPSHATGVSFGVPWRQGTVPPQSEFRLRTENEELPLQSWPLAHWPDGSLKWSGFATVVPAALIGAVILSRDSASAGGAVSVKKRRDIVVVDTGAIQCEIPSSGATLLRSIMRGDKQIAGPSQLVCILQHGPRNLPEESPTRERFVGEIKRVTVEQSGPVRAVVKIDGVHRGERSRREWLPFTTRLYFYTGLSSLRLVHTIVFDGDQEKDFIRGLGLQVEVPMRDDPRNRTVRFAGEGGVYGPNRCSPVAESSRKRQASRSPATPFLTKTPYGMISNSLSRRRTASPSLSAQVQGAHGYSPPRAGEHRDWCLLVI